MKKSLTRLEIKQAIMRDTRFRDLFPELKTDIEAVMSNPSCACNVPIFDKFFKYKDRLASYFSQREIVPFVDQTAAENQNRWSVVNCHINDLEEVLNGLYKLGRFQIAVSRYEDQATVVVNDLGIMF